METVNGKEVIPDHLGFDHANMYHLRQGRVMNAKCGTTIQLLITSVVRGGEWLVGAVSGMCQSEKRFHLL